MSVTTRKSFIEKWGMVVPPNQRPEWQIDIDALLAAERQEALAEYRIAALRAVAHDEILHEIVVNALNVASREAKNRLRES